MTSSTIPASHFPSVDALRGLAAAMVVFYHMSQCGFETLPREWIVMGSLGVNLFFTLSGFVIGRAVLQPERFDLKKYLRNRSLRILPNYYICCFIMLFIVEGRTIAEATPAHLALDLGTHAVLMHGWFGSVANSIIGPLWTLSHEWTFYLLIGIVALPLRSRLGWIVPLAMLALALVAKKLQAHEMLPPNPICLWDQFALGIFGAQLSLIATRRDRIEGDSPSLPTLYSWSAALVGLLLISWCMHRQLAVADAISTAHEAASKTVGDKAFATEFTSEFYRKKSNLIWFPCAFSAGIALLLVALTTGFTRLNAWIKNTPLPWLGTVSYSTYLYHMAVLLCLMRADDHMSEGALFTIPGAGIIVALIGVYAMSAFGYHFFEKPWLVRKLQPATSS